MFSHKKTDSVINVKVEFGEGEGKVPLDNNTCGSGGFLAGTKNNSEVIWSEQRSI